MFPVLCLTKLTLSNHFRFNLTESKVPMDFHVESVMLVDVFSFSTIIPLHGKRANVRVHPCISLSFYAEFNGNNISTWNSERRIVAFYSLSVFPQKGHFLTVMLF